MLDQPYHDAPHFGRGLARAYRDHWREHSLRLVGEYARMAEHFGVAGTRLLDVACGEGTFAVGMAANGFDVTGVDASAAMLELARARARVARVPVEWARRDMRELHVETPFDVATCWFNSLNYLLTPDDLARALRSVHDSLHPDGCFLFDVYTPHGLAVDWADQAWVAVDDDDHYIVADTRYNKRERLSTVRFVAFARNGDAWERFDERHRNRGYPWPDLRGLLADAGFERCEPFTMPGIGTPERRTERLYVAARRGE